MLANLDATAPILTHPRSATIPALTLHPPAPDQYAIRLNRTFDKQGLWPTSLTHSLPSLTGLINGT